MTMRRTVGLFSLLYALSASRTDAFIAPSSRQSSGSSLNLSPADLSTFATTATDQLNSALSVVSSDVQKFEELPVASRIAAAGLPIAAYLAPYLQPPPQVDLSDERVRYPEKFPATYELSNYKVPFEFGDAAFVRPLLKQTQLENRKLQVAFDAKKHGFNAKTFHSKVDGCGSAVVLAKADNQWFGAYNPRGWASLGGSRPSVAAFLFYKPLFGKFQKVRVLNRGGNACANDLFDKGIYMGAEGLVVPLDDTRSVRSRLGTYFEIGPNKRYTLLPRAGEECQLQELKVLVGVYAKGEDIPNSGGVIDLGLY
jgi:hypothetical protein